ncbi:hypothetical protein Cflav_PD1162 [Pedosphaera parvula Ellin514]|uniref:Uncharacterized protein n=2 Tax=Pedosphaera TaxID=1032526 RepID=B9XQ21_PEDPL|nr:hypothetical protein Cflav_PD1162 [Pedosphaera parvula Ellin514]
MTRWRNNPGMLSGSCTSEIEFLILALDGIQIIQATQPLQGKVPLDLTGHVLHALLFGWKRHRKGWKFSKKHVERIKRRNMKYFVYVFAFIVVVTRGFCADQNNSQAGTNGVVFRKPFTLTLHVDKEHYYEEEFPGIPYVHKGNVYLFKGDSFGINLDITNNTIRNVVYQADTNKAAVTLQFTQDVSTNGEAMMILVIKNNTDRKLFFDALMTVPGKKNALKTSILPVRPGLVNYESWGHPIIQLMLRNISLNEKTGTEARTSANGSQSTKSATNQTPTTSGSHR